ncbi:hypothetical protein [Duganella callida]|uniref:Lipoprotein n=1 Tax=Duganella callida TaxID=2561932 RepID=A0A4Y9SZZ2_9BURK|nr:hypothetical protein [Duganella callida]TFW30933.1 hypothetical protein E4L98_01305 [Duganella callida]
MSQGPYFLAGICAVVLTACAAPESNPPATGTQTAAATKCVVPEAVTGSSIRKGCAPTGDVKSVDPRDFRDSMQNTATQSTVK